jgi:hypothetical protein
VRDSYIATLYIIDIEKLKNAVVIAYVVLAEASVHCWYVNRADSILLQKSVYKRVACTLTFACIVAPKLPICFLHGGGLCRCVCIAVSFFTALHIRVCTHLCVATQGSVVLASKCVASVWQERV